MPGDPWQPPLNWNPIANVGAKETALTLYLLSFSSPPVSTMNIELEKAKAAIRVQLAADLGEKLAQVRKTRPELSLMQAWAELEAREPSLVAACRMAEEDDWPKPKPEPIYRYRPAREAPVNLDGILERYAPKRIQARRPREDRSSLMRVEARHG